MSDERLILQNKIDERDRIIDELKNELADYAGLKLDSNKQRSKEIDEIEARK